MTTNHTAYKQGYERGFEDYPHRSNNPFTASGEPHRMWEVGYKEGQVDAAWEDQRQFDEQSQEDAQRSAKFRDDEHCAVCGQAGIRGSACLDDGRTVPVCSSECAERAPVALAR